MNSTPNKPPAVASAAICRSPGGKPHMNNAGSVKITPEATELEAEPTVWVRLASRIDVRAPKRFRMPKAATVITAMGIDVEIVKPATSPR